MRAPRPARVAFIALLALLAAPVAVGTDPAAAEDPLTIELEVIEVTQTSASGTITCNRAAPAFVELVVEQIRNPPGVFVAGFEELGCTTEATAFDLEVTEGSGRFHAGPAAYTVYASALDGGDSAFVSEAGELRVHDSSRPVPDASNEAGLTLSITDLTATVDRGEALLAVVVDCTTPVLVDVLASVSQFAGFDLTYGGGFAGDVACDGPTTIDVVIGDQSGEIVGGLADASVQVRTFDESTGFFDFAATTGPVVLRGRTAPNPFGPPPPNPTSTITIGSYADGILTGTVRCPVTADAFVDVSMIQDHGRTTVGGWGFDDLTCTGGDDPFAVSIMTDGFWNGRAQVVVQGFAFESGPGGEIVVVYDDYQSDEIRVR